MYARAERAPVHLRGQERLTTLRVVSNGLRHLALLGVLGLVACGADATTVEGALARAAGAVAARDYDALFQALDERARHSLSSVVRARLTAAEVIRASYPAEAREPALRELGDALSAGTGVGLFRQRCGEGCLDALAASLGAPRAVEVQGRISTVTTVRDTEAQLYRADDGSYGLVWESEALVRERSRSAAELDLIRKNAAKYRAQRALSEGTR